jgi:amino-acid N-acetyltransferase
MTEESTQFISWFRSAAPYIRVHRGRTFVIQFDDDAVTSDGFIDLVHDLALLNSLGIRLVLVYSTRHSIEARLEDHHIESRYHHGMRVTDARAMDYVKDAAGKLRIEIEARLSTGLGNTPMSNADVRVTSGNFVAAKPLGIIDGVDYLYTGEVRGIDTDSIRAKLDAHEIVLIPPLGYSVTGETFNLGAGALAAKLAVALQADKLIYLMEGGSLKDGEGELVSQMTQLQAEAQLKTMTEGEGADYYYLRHAVDASAGGVDRVHLIERNIEGAILQELFTRDGVGTMISGVAYDVIRKAEVGDIAGILELIVPLEKQGILVARSREKLELEIEHFTVMLRDGVIVGTGALYPFAGEAAAELACLAVHPDYHNHGRGEELLHELEKEAGKLGVKKIFVLTTHAEHWFREQGFNASSVDELPVERKQLYNYQRNSKVLMKTVV